MADGEIDVKHITERIRRSLSERRRLALTNHHRFADGSGATAEVGSGGSDLEEILDRLKATRTTLTWKTEPFTTAQSSAHRGWVPRHTADAAPSLAADLKSLHDCYDIYDANLKSHRPVLGSMVVFAKTIVRRILTPILMRQVAYNAANTRLVTHIGEELARTRADVMALGQIVQQRSDALATDVTALADLVQRRGEIMTAWAQSVDLQFGLLVQALETFDRGLTQMRAQAVDGQRQAVEPLIQRLQVQEEEAVIRARALDTINGRLARVQAEGLPGLQAEVSALHGTVTAIVQRTENSLGQVQREMAETQKQALQVLRERVARSERTLRRMVHVVADGHEGAAPARIQQASVSQRFLEPEFDYLGFEERYRGSEAEIKERQRRYVEYFCEHENVLDVGCGRGEFLELLRDAGIRAKGIDRDLDMVLLCREKALDVIKGDALSYLEELADESLGGIFGAQLIEHLEPATIMRLIRLCHRKLKPAGTLILETVNPTCLSVFARSFYMDFSHCWPCHPEPMKFLFETSGFTDIALSFSSPIDPAVRLPHAGDLGLTGSQTGRFDRAVDFLNDLVCGYQDYAVIGRKALQRQDDAGMVS